MFINDFVLKKKIYVKIKIKKLKFNVMGSNFEITFVSEKHVVEDNILFTNHLMGKWEIPVGVVECRHSAWGGHGSGWL